MKKIAFLFLTFLFCLVQLFSQTRLFPSQLSSNSDDLQRKKINDTLPQSSRYGICGFDYEIEKSKRKGYKEPIYEAELQRLIQIKRSQLGNFTGPVIIPVIFHIVYRNGAVLGNSGNLSQSQIQAQLSQLNLDFSNQSGSSYSVSANVGIQFCLALVDTAGRPLVEPGIHRVNGQALGWQNTNDFTNSLDLQDYVNSTIKPATIWDPDRYLNIWTIGISTNLLGWATFPQFSNLPGITTTETDSTAGVVLNWGTVGSIANPGPSNSVSPYNIGRTLSHEAGHFFGLRHIWGDSNCGEDYCDDTPKHDGPTSFCPTGIAMGNCIPNQRRMFENYMDYTVPTCMNTFTFEQSLRCQTVMDNSLRRSGLLGSKVCNSRPSNSIQFASKALGVYETGDLGTCPKYKNYSVNIYTSVAAIGPATVSFASLGTAVLGKDFTISPSSISYSSGDNSIKTITISVIDDESWEQLEEIKIGLVISGSGVVLGPEKTSYSIFVYDDDNVNNVGIDNTNPNSLVLLEDFNQNQNLPIGWDIASLGDNTSNNWVIGSNGGQATTGNSAYISKNNILKPNSYDKTSASNLFLATPLLDFTGLMDVNLKFKWRSVGEDGYDEGRIGYIPESATSNYDFSTIRLQNQLSLQQADYLFSKHYSNSRFYMYFRWFNDDSAGVDPGLTIDDVEIRAKKLSVATTTDADTLFTVFSGNRVRFYSYPNISNTSARVIADLDAVSQDFGCTSASISQSQVMPQTFITPNGAYLRSGKVISLSPSIVNSGTCQISLYFTSSEVNSWGISGPSSLKLVRVNNGVPLTSQINLTNAEIITPSVSDNRNNFGYVKFTATVSAKLGQFFLVSPTTLLFYKPVISPSNDTTICQGQQIALSAPSGFSSYQWSNGATSQSIIVNQSGIFSVRVTDNVGTTSVWSDGVSVSVENLPAIPTITRQNISNGCIGQQLLLSSSVASSYQWYRNDTLIQSAINQTYQPNVNAAYRVRVFSPNRACSSQSDTVMVNLSGLNVTGLIQQDTIKACGVDSVTLDAGAGYGNYQWSNGANTRTIRVGSSGKYTVQVTCGPNVYNSNYFSTVSTGSPRPSASIPNASQYSFTNNMTIIYRLRVENVPNGANVVLQKGEGSSFQFSIPSWPFLKFTYPGIGKPNGLNAQISQWNWVWVSVVKTPDSVFLYVNNVIADRAASPNPIPVTTSPIIIGKAQEWDYFSGSVDQLSFWNRSLTGAEISNYQNCMIGTESGCVGFYNFDQTITATIPDFSTFGNTAINNGRVIGYGSPFLTCQGTVISDSVYVSIIKTGIAQNDTSICRSSTLTLAATNATSAATNICTTAQLSTSLRNGVVAFYPFCGSVNDVSGNGFNGSNSGATFINDRLGNAGSAMDFNGTNANISLPTNINNSITNELTLGMWVYLRAIPDANHRYLFYSGNGEWGLNYDNSTIYFSVKLSDGTWWSAGAATPTYLNRWTYFTCQYKKGAFVKLFADGNLLNQQVIPNLELSKPNLPSFIGSVYGNLRYANASIDNVILHNRILSNSEISSFTSPAETYIWSTGSTASSISVTPTQSTTYYLTTTDGIASCTDSVRVTIATVDTAVAVLDPLSICTGSGQVRLQAALGLSYQWLRNGVPISGATSRIYTATQAGQYRVALSNSITCRDTSRIVTVIENPKPLAAFTTNVANQCLSGNLYNFTNTSSISSGTISYLWSFGDGNTATTSNATYSYTTAGTYTVKLVVTSSLGCKDSTTRSVTVFPKPAVDFTVNSLSQCVNGNSFVFTNNSTISTGTITYIWRFGDGNSATTTNASYTYTLPGTYVVKLIATSNNGCSDSTTKTVTVNPKPTVDFSINNPAQCLSVNQFVFTNNSTITAGTLSHTWDFGNGASSVLSSPTYTYANPGSFTVKLVSTSAAGCKDSISRQVTVHPMPTGALSTPTTNLLCEGGNLLLSATGGNTYQWLLNGGAIPGAVNATHSATQPGVYTVNVISSNGCVSPATGSVTLQLVVRPTVNFVYDKYCAGFPTLFANQSNTSNSNIVSYSWSFGQGQATSTLQSPSYTFSTAGVYNVSLTVTPLACPSLAASLSKPVTIVAPPPNQRYIPLNAVENRDLQLEARNLGGANYLWTPPSGLSNPAILNPIFNFNTEVDYVVTITTGIGCIIKDTQLVRIFKEKEIYVPKGFSPNADGNNDKIFPRLVGVRTLSYFKVYNRWGQLLYQTSNPEEGWDGTYRGVKQPMETYVWMAEGIDIDNNTIKRTGNFLLLR